METAVKKHNLLLVAKASSLFNIQRSTIYRRIGAGTLEGYTINNKVYVDSDEMLSWKEHTRPSRRGTLWRMVDNLWQDGHPDGDIARLVGRSRERVRQIRAGLGKQANPRKARLPKGTYLP